MAREVASSLLAAGSFYTAELLVAFTCPAGKTTIIKEFDFHNGGPASTTVKMALDLTPGVLWSWRDVEVPAGVAVHVSVWTVITGGYRLRLNQPAPQPVGYWISGAVLDGVTTPGTQVTFSFDRAHPMPVLEPPDGPAA